MKTIWNAIKAIWADTADVARPESTDEQVKRKQYQHVHTHRHTFADGHVHKHVHTHTHTED